MTTRRREDPQVRRGQILEAAERCFRARGFQASTVDQIAAEAGVSVGLLYRFFDSKSSIIEAIILDAMEAQLAQATIAIENASGEPFETLRAMTSRLAPVTLDGDRIALMLDVAAEVCRNPTLRSFVQTRRAEAKDTLVKKLKSKGVAKKQAERMIARLELISALATGTALHAVLYSEGSLEGSLRLVSTLIDAKEQRGHGSH